jgi:hypothetical protein
MRASLVDTRPDDDFGYQVASRVFYDPQGADGADDSLQNYIQPVSYGQASISGIVFPTVRSADADVTGAAMDRLPSGHGYTHRWPFFRTPSGPIGTPGRGGMSTHATASRAFATVALFEDPNQTRRQSTGVWAMETLHMVTEFGDLYNGSPSTGRTTLWPTPALRVTRAPIRSLRWAGSRPQTSLAINPGPGPTTCTPSVSGSHIHPAGLPRSGSRSFLSKHGWRSISTNAGTSPAKASSSTKTQRPVGTARLPVGAPSASKVGAL